MPVVSKEKKYFTSTIVNVEEKMMQSKPRKYLLLELSCGNRVCISSRHNAEILLQQAPAEMRWYSDQYEERIRQLMRMKMPLEFEWLLIFHIDIFHAETRPRRYTNLIETSPALAMG